MHNQDQASIQRGLPVDIASESPTITSGSESSVQLKYYNSGTLTNDAGQAAGTIVVAKLEKGRVADELGSVTASHNNTSLSFTSTALTNEVAFPYKIAEGLDTFSGTVKAQNITSGFSNGDYCVDYRTGTIYGVKTSTQTALTTVTYLAFAGGGDTLADKTIAGEDLTADVMKVEHQYTYANIAAATTTTVKSGSGFFHTLVINDDSAAGAITIYDNTAASGTKIATIAGGSGETTRLYDVQFSTGLTIVTAAADDITVSYR